MSTKRALQTRPDSKIDASESVLDPFKERLLNPFIFSLVIAFISRYRIELYDLFASTTNDSDKALNALSLWDGWLWITVSIVILVYLISISLGSLVFALKEAVKRYSDLLFSKVAPVSADEYSSIVQENQRVRNDLLTSRLELVSSSEKLAELLINIIKQNSPALDQLEIIMPHYRQNTRVPFAYSKQHQTKYSYGIFELPSNDFSVCFPILMSGASQLICVKFKIQETNFVYHLGSNQQMSTQAIEIPVSYVNALEYQRWAEVHYFDEASSTWTTTIPSRKRVLSVKFDQNTKVLVLKIVQNAAFNLRA